jgi:2,4-dienoyl-CoA reductase-like NADH-dependent reductase (Old Yellow Enzyme family)
LSDLGQEATVLTDLSPLVQGLADGAFDLVAVGRALLADPGWARKVKEGRFDQLEPFTKDALDNFN